MNIEHKNGLSKKEQFVTYRTMRRCLLALVLTCGIATQVAIATFPEDVALSENKIYDEGGVDGIVPGNEMIYDLVRQADGRYNYTIAGVSGKTSGKGYDDIRDIVFSKDGSKYAYEAKVGNKWMTVVNGAEGKQYDDIPWYIIFSPDGNRSAYLAQDGDNTVVVADGIEEAVISKPNYIVPGTDVMFSPDGKRLTYNYWKGSVSFIVLDGKELNIGGNGFVFSPNSTRWAYAGWPEDIILNDQIIDLKLSDWVKGMYFSPDSKRFVFDICTNINAYCAHIVVADDVHSNIYPFPGVSKVFFSPDSNKIAYTAKSNEDGYFVVADNVEGRRYAEIAEPILFSNDSSHMAYVAKDFNGSWFVVYDNVEGNKYSGILSLTLSPDNKSFAYVAKEVRNDKDVQFVVVNETEKGPYIVDWYGQGIRSGPVFSPDGSHIGYFANDGGKGEVVVIDNTKLTNPWALIAGSSLTFDSPDSFHYLGSDGANTYLVTSGGDVMVIYYRGLGQDPSVVETDDLLKAIDDWRNGVPPPGFSVPITTDQLLTLANEWRNA
jgi:Tol biopolymer transport system component